MKMIIYSKNEKIIEKNKISNGIYLLVKGNVSIKTN